MRRAVLLLSIVLVAACGGRPIESAGDDIVGPGDQVLPRAATERTGVYIVTDQASYTVYGDVVATIINATSEPIWVEGCSAFLLMHDDNGGWAEIGPAAHCGYASVPRRIAPGGQWSESFWLGDAGGWFLRSRYATACQGEAPPDLSVLSATGEGKADITRCSVRYARSPEIAVR